MRKGNFKLSIIVSLIVIISISATYAYMELSAINNNSTGTGGCFLVNYTGQAINNSSLQSTSSFEDLTSASSTIILSKNENCEIYTEAEILIHTNSTATDAPLSNGAMKYQIKNGSTIVSSGVIAAVTETSEDQLLATVPLTETNTTYTVYLWIDSTISQGTYNGKTYSGYLYARSTQSSTITGT